VVQQPRQPSEDLFVAPGAEVAVHRLPRWVVVRRVAPRDAGAVHVQNRIGDGAQVVLEQAADARRAGAAPVTPGGQGRLDQLPACVGQVAGVARALGHAMTVTPVNARDHRRSR